MGEELNEPFGNNDNTVIKNYLYRSYCPIISFVKRPKYSDIIGISPLEWLFSTKVPMNNKSIIILFLVDVPLIHELNNVIEWKDKENVLIYRGSVAGLFDSDGVDISITVYEKLMSINKSDMIKYDFALTNSTYDDYIDNYNNVIYVTPKSTYVYDKSWIITKANKYKFIMYIYNNYIVLHLNYMNISVFL